MTLPRVPARCRNSASTSGAARRSSLPLIVRRLCDAIESAIYWRAAIPSRSVRLNRFEMDVMLGQRRDGQSNTVWRGNFNRTALAVS